MKQSIRVWTEFK